MDAYSELTMTEALRKARTNYKRALAHHHTEQEMGRYDMSPRQTRRMALASKYLGAAAWRLTDIQRRISMGREV